MTVKTAILTFALALPRAVCAADVLVTEGLRAGRRAGQMVPASESTMPTPRTLGTRTARRRPTALGRASISRAMTTTAGVAGPCVRPLLRPASAACAPSHRRRLSPEVAARNEIGQHAVAHARGSATTRKRRGAG